MRDYAAELTEYARVAAPVCGWNRHVFIDDMGMLTFWGKLYDPNAGALHDPPQQLPACVAAVALCESHLADWLGLNHYLEIHSSGVGFVVNRQPANDSRLLALISAVAATKQDAERGAGG